MGEKISLAPMYSSKQNSQVLGPAPDEAAIVMNKMSDVHIWSAQEYPDGFNVDAVGECYECRFDQRTTG